MGKLKMFTLTGPTAKLSIACTAARKKNLRQTPMRIGQYQFVIYDSGEVPTVDTVVNIPFSHQMFTYPITFATDDPQAFDLTETRFRKLLTDSILNPEMFEDDEDDEDEWLQPVEDNEEDDGTYNDFLSDNDDDEDDDDDDDDDDEDDDDMDEDE